MADMYDPGNDAPVITFPTPADNGQATDITNTQPTDTGTDQQPIVQTIDLSTVKDPDMVDFYRAQAEIGEIKLVDAETSTDTPAQAEQPKVGDQPKPTPPKDQLMVPKARLDSVLNRVETAEQQAAYWRGVAEARAEPRGGSGQQADITTQPATVPQQPLTFEQQLAALAEEEDAIATKFDDGEITAKEMNAQLRTVRSREAGLREDMLRQQITSTMPKPTSVDEVKVQLESEQREATLYEQHPLAAIVFPPAGSPQDQAEAADPGVREVMDSMRSSVRALAKQEMLRNHPGISGHQADALFQSYIAKAADQYARTNEAFIPQAIPRIATPQAGGTTGQKPLSPTAQARLDKMGVAANQPPDMGNLGSSRGSADEWTPERYAGLTDDQLARLPQHIHDRFV